MNAAAATVYSHHINCLKLFLQLTCLKTVRVVCLCLKYYKEQSKLKVCFLYSKPNLSNNSQSTTVSKLETLLFCPAATWLQFILREDLRHNLLKQQGCHDLRNSDLSPWYHHIADIFLHFTKRSSLGKRKVKYNQ